MKPITLTMSAFGPYAGETTLDFSALGLQRLFVITGPTGSGKTTVFEGMLYALYGCLSKRGMDPASLRCDFLKPDDERVTFVDFRFEIAGKTYQIHRQPKQRVAKKRGSGTREIAQEAVLECVGHEDFLPLTKISEVDRKIVELIGLDEEQFKKIVMLPQGAFQEFLVSPTKDKIELLRHIFDTGLYDLALQRIKSRVGEVTEAYGELKAQYRSQVSLLRFAEHFDAGEQPSPQALAQMDALLAAAEAQTAALQEAVDTAGLAYTAAVERFNREKQHNEDVAKWQTAQREMDALQARQDEQAQFRARVTDAEQARSIVEQEQRANEKREEERRQRRVVEQAQARVQTAAAQLATTEQRCAEAEAAHKVAAAAFENLPVLTARLEKMQQYVNGRAQYAAAQQELRKAERSLTEAREQLSQSEQALQQLTQAADEKRQLETARQAQALKQATVRETLSQERAAYKPILQYLKLQEARPALVEKATQTAQALTSAEDALQKGRAQRGQQLAATLAEDLREGAPCPVCGAVHHPAPAQLPAHVPDEDALLDACNKVQQAHAAATTALTMQDQRLAEVLAEIQESFPDVSGVEQVTQLEAQLRNNGIRNKTELDRLTQALQEKDAALAALGDVDKQRDALGQKLDALRLSQNEWIAQQSTWQSAVTMRQEELAALEASEGFTAEADPEALAREIQGIRNSYQQSQQHFEQAQQTRTQCQIDQAEAAKALELAQQQLQASETAAQESAQQFLKARTAVFTERDAYEGAKADIARRAALQQAIDDYNQELTRVQTLLGDLGDRLGEDRTPVDLAVSEAQCQAAQTRHSQASEALSAHEARLQDNRRGIAQIRQLLASFEELEARFALLGQLRDVLDGKNLYNMRLETFAQTYYFEQMLSNANVRLARMTHGRYAFRRKDSVKDGRCQAGLDLDVMDQYTGRARDVSTLSGGESFKASLSLALGLADVVASESGGVELSTIFIDEGFGTLDEESLDDTVETLINLQDSGRLVGVISHVAELKERIPAHLVVSGGAQGSHAHFEVRE